MKNLLPTLFLFFTITFSFAQETPESLVDGFFKAYETSGTEIALNNLYSTNPWIDTSSSSVIQLKNQLPLPKNSMLGDYLGYELITIKQVTKDFYISTYFVKYDRQMIRFSFSFYRPYDKWRLTALRFDDDYNTELQESMKLYYHEFVEFK